MIWRVEWDERARKELRSLDKPVQNRILKYMRERLSENPYNFGAALVGDSVGLCRYRYRVDAYRVICVVDDSNFVIRVLQVGHRKEVYH